MRVESSAGTKCDRGKSSVDIERNGRSPVDTEYNGRECDGEELPACPGCDGESSVDPGCGTVDNGCQEVAESDSAGVDELDAVLSEPRRLIRKVPRVRRPLVLYFQPLLLRGHPDRSYIHRVDAPLIYLSYSYKSCEDDVEDRKDTARRI